MILIFLLVGLILGIMFRPGWGNIVMKILPKEKRFIDFGIDEETAISIVCEDKKGYPPHRFLKLRSGFVGKTGRFVRRSTTRFIGKEGTAYTWQTEQGEITEIPGGLPATLIGVWGEEFFNEIPEEKRLEIEESKILVTVDLDDGLTPASMRSVSEEDIKREQDREAAKNLWEGKKQSEKGLWLNYLIYGIAGFGIACFLIVIGILKLPTTFVPGPSQTASMLFGLGAVMKRVLIRDPKGKLITKPEKTKSKAGRPRKKVVEVVIPGEEREAEKTEESKDMYKTPTPPLREAGKKEKESGSAIVSKHLAPQLLSAPSFLNDQAIDERKTCVINEITQTSYNYFSYRGEIDQIRFWNWFVDFELTSSQGIGGLARRHALQAIANASGVSVQETARRPNVLARNVWSRDWEKRAESEGKRIEYD